MAVNAAGDVGDVDLRARAGEHDLHGHAGVVLVGGHRLDEVAVLQARLGRRAARAHAHDLAVGRDARRVEVEARIEGDVLARAGAEAGPQRACRQGGRLTLHDDRVDVFAASGSSLPSGVEPRLHRDGALFGVVLDLALQIAQHAHQAALALAARADRGRLAQRVQGAPGHDRRARHRIAPGPRRARRCRAPCPATSRAPRARRPHGLVHVVGRQQAQAREGDHRHVARHALAEPPALGVVAGRRRDALAAADPVAGQLLGHRQAQGGAPGLAQAHLQERALDAGRGGERAMGRRCDMNR